MFLFKLDIVPSIITQMTFCYIGDAEKFSYLDILKLKIKSMLDPELSYDMYS